MATRPEFLPGLDGSDIDPIFDEGPMAGLGGGSLNMDPTNLGPQQPTLIGDLYPVDEEEYDKLLRWMQNAFEAADRAREPYADRWRRFYKLYRSYMKRNPNEWNSKVFIPISFWIIETVTPRLVAQLPKFFTEPVGPEDVKPAQTMEYLLEWAKEQSDLYVELVKAYKSALKYGTGILKTFHRIDKRRARKIQPLSAPLNITRQREVLGPDGLPMFDMDGQPIVETYEDLIGEIPMGTSAQQYEYVAYDGPAAECIDIFNFWVAPEAHDEQSARYVFHRTYREMDYIQERVKEGIYRWPENMSLDEISDTTDDPNLSRLDDIGLGPGQGADPTRKAAEVLECWTNDGRVITMVNRKAIVRVQKNPFDHSEKPFVRFVDYLQEHEFWGVGEIEPLEGLQDAQNALTNSRIDNLRLVLNAMFAVNVNNVEDIRDLKMRPGGVIRLKGDFKPADVIERVNLGDVTQTAFQEAQTLNDFIEKVSGVSAYQMGLDSPSLNNTATGVAIIQEQGASRFGLKSRLSELMALRRLGRHFGSILQQFTTEERLVRMYGPDGQMLFQTFTPESIQGGIDYDVEAGSPTQTQTARQNNATQVFQLLQGAVGMIDPQTGQPLVPSSGLLAALEDLLESMNIKDKQRYLMQPQQPALPPGVPNPMDPMQQGGMLQPGMDPSQMVAPEQMPIEQQMAGPMDINSILAQANQDQMIPQGEQGMANADAMMQAIQQVYDQGAGY